MSAPFRCGDHVLHRPSGETWVVAFCDGDDMAPAGWPACMARTADCERVYAATDEQHAKAVDEWRDVSVGGWIRSRVLRLYGNAEAPA